jgi:RsiW-degrading membrane proteinase PrsW (M82 family)
MLIYSAIAKVVVVPIALGCLLTALMRRSASLWLLLAAFGAGFFGAFALNQLFLRYVPSMLPDGQVLAKTTAQAWLSGFVDAALPEELSKGIVILVFVVAGRRYAAHDGALIGGLVGLGFALRENVAYAQISPDLRGMAVLSHAAWGLIMGNLMQRAFVGERWRVGRLLWAFVPPVLLHGVLDASIFLVEAYESQKGIDPNEGDPSIEFSGVLLAEMLTTVAISIFETVWAIRIILAGRRQESKAEDPRDPPTVALHPKSKPTPNPPTKARG